MNLSKNRNYFCSEIRKEISHLADVVPGNVILDGLRWLGLDWYKGSISGDATGPSKGEYDPGQRGYSTTHSGRKENVKRDGVVYDSAGRVLAVDPEGRDF